MNPRKKNHHKRRTLPKFRNETSKQRVERMKRALEYYRKRREKRIQQKQQARPKFTVNALIPKTAAKYGAWTQEFNVNLDRADRKENINFLDIKNEITELFQSIIDETTKNHNKLDKIQISVHSNENIQGRNFSTRLIPIKNIRASEITTTVERAMNSNEDFVINAGFRVDVVIMDRKATGKAKGLPLSHPLYDKARKRSVIQICNSDELCMARAIVVGMAKLKKQPRSICFKKSAAQTRLAKELHCAANVPERMCTSTDAQKFADTVNIQIKIVENLIGKYMVTSSTQPERKNVIYLWRLNMGESKYHFHLINNIKGFFCTSYYCTSCDKKYSHKFSHDCETHCRRCFRNNCTKANTVLCSKCNRICRNITCLKQHEAICAQFWFCPRCNMEFKRNKMDNSQHVCGTTNCKGCGKYENEDHRCYMRNIEPKDSKCGYIFFDFETDQSSGVHIVNYAAAMYQDGTPFEFEGYDAIDKFCTWLFDIKHNGITAIAHNAKSFDSQFIQKWLLEHSITPKVIKTGSKLLELKHQTLNIRIIDSVNFFAAPLSGLPKMFGLKNDCKGHFPHFFNIRENQNYIGKWPLPYEYGAQYLAPKDQSKFYEWYETVKDGIFDFRQEIRKYCLNDVEILRNACNVFRKLFMETCDIDPFTCITIASACLATYKHKYMKPNSIGILPVQGYNQRKSSRKAVVWLEWIMDQEDIIIRHDRNNEFGEKCINGIAVDGYCEETNTIYEFDGCYWHGCPNCYEPLAKNVVNNKPMKLLREETIKKHQQLRSMGYEVVTIKECEFDKMLRQDENMQMFEHQCPAVEKLKVRDCLFGGRTNAIKLYHECQGTEQIKYIDYTSLYPFVMRTFDFPIGHPNILYNVDVAEIDNHFGICQITVLPPNDLFHPVLPYRTNGKLYFTLCRTCANTNQKHCTHSDKQRAITGTYTTEETKLAISKGYKLLKIHELYSYEKKSPDLFRDYIDTFYKMKEKASLDKNEGLRTLTKLCLNSLWGRFAMNENKSQSEFVDEVKRCTELVDKDERNEIEIGQIIIISDDILEIVYTSTPNFVAQTDKTNVILASFVTSYARMHLYRALDELQEKVLYMDTDSVFYVSPDGTHILQLGDQLGDFKDEIGKGDYITHMASLGPKSYTFLTKSGENDVVKVKGMRKNAEFHQKVTFDSIKESLDAALNGNKKTISINDRVKFVVNKKTKEIENKPMIKDLNFTYEKRVVMDNFMTLPYGHKNLRKSKLLSSV
jgi:hypothetical protein